MRHGDIDLGAIRPIGSTIFCAHRKIVPIMDNFTRVFRGRVEDGLCFVPCRVRGSSIMGRALLDTGCQAATIATAFVEANGLAVDFERAFMMHGVGSPPHLVGTTRAVFELLPEEGQPLGVGPEISVTLLHPPSDMLVGVDILANGVFTYNGPAGTWEWIVQSRDVDARNKPATHA